MKLAIVGSRTYNNYAAIHRLLYNLTKNYNIEIVISGGAKGVDSLAEKAATALNIPTLIFKADWNKFGKSAGYRRNIDIIQNSTHVIAIWDGESKGTLHSINLAKKYNKKLKILKYKGSRL